MSSCFPDLDIKGVLGFGCMRLPMRDGEVVCDEFNKMIDEFMTHGFNYFDTAHGYLSGKSETALRECLTSRYPRESYILTNKLSENFFECEANIRPYFEVQLKACGVDYFDFYLLHAQNAENYKKYKRCRAYEAVRDLKKEGKVRHFGLSFHDSAEVLEMILSENPDVEAVQLQFNYADYESPSVQSRLCYEVCRRHSKPVIVMEPVKGGSLANLPAEAKKVFDEIDSVKSPASYALRYAAGIDGIFMVLSGMSNTEQMLDNLSFMKRPEPLTEKEQEAVARVRDILATKGLIRCTACRYCTDGCPQSINIPALFSCLNSKRIYKTWNAEMYYNDVHAAAGGKASDCIECGKCEASCPQHLKIRELLREVAKEFE